MAADYSEFSDPINKKIGDSVPMSYYFPFSASTMRFHQMFEI